MTIAAISTPIELPFPDVAAPNLRIAAIACVLHIQPGGPGPWVAGTYQDPSGRMPLHISEQPDGAELRVGTDLTELVGLLDGPPRLDLTLGTGHPFSLDIEAGASENRIELGGLRLTRLVLNEGAGKVTLTFSAPNPARMSLLKIGVGAGAVEARGLANAAFSEMQVDGGAAGVELEFGGSLQVNGYVRISTALSGTDLFIAPSVAAEVTWSSLLGAPDADAGFTRSADAYCTHAAIEGSQPRLRIHNAAALGGLRLRSAPAPTT